MSATIDVDGVLARLYPPENPFLYDPVGWVANRTKEYMWSKQREIAESVRDNRYTAVRSCHGSGKSFTASRICAWWLDAHPPGEAFIVTTAPTYKQVHAVLWREIGKAHRLGDLPGRVTQSDEWSIGAELVGFGRKPADYDPAAFSGVHARYVLVVIDEAGGVPQSIFEAVDSLVIGKYNRVLAIGNPDDPTAFFATVCKPGSGWNQIGISAFDTPNFTDERDEVPEDILIDLISEEWVEERKKRWGVNSPIYTAKVLGEFPDISDDTLIMPKWIKAAQELDLSAHRTNRPKLGIDIARMGEDESVAMRREGGWARVAWSAHKTDTMVTAGHIAKLMREMNTEVQIEEYVAAQIDGDGLGAGVYDRLNEQEYDVVEFRGGLPPIDSERFLNRRAECYWMLRERFENGEIDIDPYDDVLASQLGSIKWSTTSRGQIKIESKEDMRKRGMPSPDRADALMETESQFESFPKEMQEHASKALTAGLMDMKWG